MPYVPRPPVTEPCAHCGQLFESRNLRRKYCSNSCNVLASYARNGRRGETRPTKAQLEVVVNKLIKLLEVKDPQQIVDDISPNSSIEARLAAASLRAQELRANRLAVAREKAKALKKRRE